jgi:hypothetical protein
MPVMSVARSILVAALAATGACASNPSRANAFLEQQALEDGEPFATIVMMGNAESMTITAIDGVSTRLGNVDRWTNDTFPAETKVRPGPHVIRFGVHGVDAPGADTPIQAEAGRRYEFVVERNVRLDKLKPVLATP